MLLNMIIALGCVSYYDCVYVYLSLNCSTIPIQCVAVTIFLSFKS